MKFCFARLSERLTWPAKLLCSACCCCVLYCWGWMWVPNPETSREGFNSHSTMNLRARDGQREKIEKNEEEDDDHDDQEDHYHDLRFLSFPSFLNFDSQQESQQNSSQTEYSSSPSSPPSLQTRESGSSWSRHEEDAFTVISQSWQQMLPLLDYYMSCHCCHIRSPLFSQNNNKRLRIHFHFPCIFTNVFLSMTQVRILELFFE